MLDKGKERMHQKRMKSGDRIVAPKEGEMEGLTKTPFRRPLPDAPPPALGKTEGGSFLTCVSSRVRGKDGGCGGGGGAIFCRRRSQKDGRKEKCYEKNRLKMRAKCIAELELEKEEEEKEEGQARGKQPTVKLAEEEGYQDLPYPAAKCSASLGMF